MLSRRWLCSAAASVARQQAAHRTLGLQMGTSRAVIRARFYELAKQTHPDSCRTAALEAPPSEASSSRFVEIRDAFEVLMAACREDDHTSSSTAATSARNSARGATHRERQRQHTAASDPPRAPSLGEVLCGRLQAEPGAWSEVWQDLRTHTLPVTGAMADTLFKAIARSEKIKRENRISKISNSGVGESSEARGMSSALDLFREASRLGMLNADARPAALVSLLSWCRESSLDASFDVCNEVREEDKTPELLAALSETFSYFPSGASF
tara:strand:- start:77 stop:883 length:807 start_codon:yes stop_codon:yes gene_type:complete